MPLFHSLACSLQLKVRSETWGGTKTHAQMNAHTHPTLARGLKHFHPRAFFIQRCDILPWHVIKKCPRFWGSDSHCLQMSSRDRSRRGCRMMSWCWITRVNLAPREGGGHRTYSSRGMMGAARCIHVLPWLQALLFYLSLTEGSVAPRPWDFRGKHSVPLSGSDNPFVLTQSILAHFLFLSLALFLHLPCRGDRGIWDNLCGRVHRQPGKCSSSFSLPSAPPEWLPFAPLH